MDTPRSLAFADPLNLEAKFLVATPAMDDPRFRQSVVFVCAHDNDGTMGIVVNKPVRAQLGGTITLGDVLQSAGVEGDIDAGIIHKPVLAGGPVEDYRGFVLHSGDYQTPEGTLPVSETLMLTSTKDVLRALATDAAPAQAVLAIGYAGWGGGQVEEEIAANAWIVCEPSDVDALEHLVFGTDLAAKWAEALGEIGIDPARLAPGGQA